MTPEDITRVRWVSDPQLAPDGRRVAFVVTTLSAERDEYLSNVWLVDTEAGGEGPRRFTTGPLRDTAPRWSPDGRWLAFLSEREGPQGKAQLYVMPAGGGEPVRLTQLPNGVKDAVWSPDGRRLAVTSRVGGWQEPEDEAERAKSKPARIIGTLKYKLDNEGFVYDRRSHVFVVPFPGDALFSGAPPAPRQVTDGDWDDLDPAWSPDGRRLAFVSARHAGRDTDNAADVWLVDAEGAGAEPGRLTDTAGPLRHPVFSPDGSRVAFVGHRYSTESGRNMRVFSVPATPAGLPEAAGAGGPRLLTGDLDRTCAPFAGTVRPLWLPDGAGPAEGWLVFAVEDEGDVPLYRVRGDGSEAAQRLVGGARQVTSLSACGQPALPGAPAPPAAQSARLPAQPPPAPPAAGGGLLAFAATDPVSPAEVFVCAADGTGERRLTDLNREWKGEVALSAPERFRYERAGYTLDGWLMRPAGFQAGRRYPLLLNIHGGPATQYGHTFFDEFQVYAGAGYAVLFTNPRGSQGYGEAFTRAITKDWGHEDFLDVMAGLDEALGRFDFLDPQRLGVMGGSYGGFLTSWVVGHSDRFKAACSERALNDHASFFGTSDIGPGFAADYAGSLPWEDPAWYAEHSPLTFAPRITTPLLIIHAENDLRCPIGQAEALYAALKRLGQEVTLVRFPDEGHELSRSGKPRHRLERFRVILDWFARYLEP